MEAMNIHPNTRVVLDAWKRLSDGSPANEGPATYDDAALVILDNLAPGGPTSRQCVGVALPRGMKAHKAEVPS